MATQKLKPITQPDNPINNDRELNEVIRESIRYIRIKSRDDATRGRRLSKVNKEFDERNLNNNKVLEPLLDRIFSYVVQHWSELAPATAPESIELNDVNFKRYLDQKGSVSVDDEKVISYIENIEKSEMIMTLRKVLPQEIIDDLVSQLKDLVSYTMVAVLDSSTLKTIIKKQPLLTIPGFDLTFNSKVTMHINQSPVEKKEKKPRMSEARALPTT